MRWSILPWLLATACLAPPDPAGDAATADPSDAAAADHPSVDAGAVDAGPLNRCTVDHDRVTLRAVDQRRWLLPGLAPVSSATSSAADAVAAAVDRGVVEVRALAAGSAQITIDSSGSVAEVAVDVDLTDSLFATAVVEVHYGTGAGFGQDNMPAAVLGPPQGGGAAAGSLDVVSLGQGGSITVELGVDAVDGPGTDLIVFENPFVGFLETGRVEVSADGQQFFAFACDGATQAGCAGVNPVRASRDNGIDPTDPTLAGGDAFDLASIGLARARYLRIVDVGGIDTGGGKAGFDLDAVVAVNSVPRGTATLIAPPPLTLAVGSTRSPRFDLGSGDRVLYGAAVACRAEPAGLIEVACGCNLVGVAAGAATVTARLGELERTLAVTIGD